MFYFNMIYFVFASSAQSDTWLTMFTGKGGGLGGRVNSRADLITKIMKVRLTLLFFIINFIIYRQKS
jgi:hypothetical protein